MLFSFSVPKGINKTGFKLFNCIGLLFHYYYYKTAHLLFTNTIQFITQNHFKF